MFAGMILADLEAKDHVPLDFCPTDAKLPRAFEIAGQGKLPEGLLVELKQHSAVVYLRFPLDLSRERDRVLKFSSVLRRVGGLAVKVESAGVAHTWERWSRSCPERRSISTLPWSFSSETRNTTTRPACTISVCQNPRHRARFRRQTPPI
jgi:hypothetical protein